MVEIQFSLKFFFFFKLKKTHKKVVGSMTSLGPLYVHFACSPCVCWVLSKLSGLVLEPENMHVW